jgi:D-alanyl-D-alanine carboxypeptidase
MKLIKYLKDRIFFVVMLAFVFVASLAISFGQKEMPKANTFFNFDQGNLPPIPTLINPESYPVLSAQAALAIDIDSGITLYEKNPDLKLLPASTTKIITAMVAIDYYPLDKVLTVGDIGVVGQKMNLVKGEQLKVADLLYGLLVYSANDAAEALAQNYLGGRDGFIRAMNAKAQELHMTNTHFTNPTGLDGGAHYSTARDLIRASYVAVQNDTFAEIVKTKEKTIVSVDGKVKHQLANINKLLETVDGVVGIKTGWTEEARENLVSYVNRDNHRIMFALLGSQDRFGETKELINWIFVNFEWKEVSIP